MILRSALYVPATRPELYEQALASAADAVILDLEDAIAPDRKAEARANVVALLGGSGAGAAGVAPATRPPKPVYVRVNALGASLAYADVEAVSGLPIAGVRVPKVEGAEQVRTVGGWLDGTGLELWCLIESALGLERAFEIASAHPAVASIGLGEADLRASLRVGADDAGLAYARGRCVAAARAAGRALGFLGRNCVHPAQVDTVNAAFTPSEEDVMRAREIVDALASVVEAGAGAVALPDGRFVDLAVVEQARALLDLAARVGTR